ncbi:MAG: pyrroloquinoline quinone biosynthesis protein PqqB [Planctomycetes bacterium]|nr:pyrroloquinoline quinone biosynthesis protein PqqB [Planctomycetota bacterium]
MRIRILGSAAGGGLPQWNCRCPNCEAVRAGSPDITARTQSSVAISADGRNWFLLNVSADVRQQLMAFPKMWPTESATSLAADETATIRGTTIAGCILTDAEIDHASGLLQLREGCAFNIFSTPIVARWLSEYLPIYKILADFAERPQMEIALDEVLALPLPNGEPSGLRVRAFEVGRDVPRFVPEDADDAVGSVIGLQIEDTVTGGKLVYAPGVSSICDALRDATEQADGILIDGTFWTDDEPVRMGITNRTACQMGHVPVSGSTGTLQWLSQLSLRHRVYVHINNTNPMLNEAGPEWQHVNQVGVHVGADGDEFKV